MFDRDRKIGTQPDAYHEYGYSTGTPPQGNHVPADDVFGDEEGAQVINTPAKPQQQSQLLTSSADPIPDHELAPRRRPDDS